MKSCFNFILLILTKFAQQDLPTAVLDEVIIGELLDLSPRTQQQHANLYECVTLKSSAVTSVAEMRFQKAFVILFTWPSNPTSSLSFHRQQDKPEKLFLPPEINFSHTSPMIIYLFLPFPNPPKSLSLQSCSNFLYSTV